MSALPSDQAAVALTVFLQQVGASRFLTVRDGAVVCLDPESAEAQALYQQVQAALAAGTIVPVPPVPTDAEQM